MDNFNKYVTYAGLTANPYQYEGVKWCLDHELLSYDGGGGGRGGILADEMGLGKTITMIGLMIANILDRTLIVLPPILIQQWRDQIYKTTNHEALIYHGRAKKKITMAMLSTARIVITSYDTIRVVVAKNNDIHNVEWSRVIFDEAHHLRNKNTARYIGATRLQTGIRWMVTGTPIQNRKRDIVNLCSLVGIQEVDDLRILSQRYILRRSKKDVGIVIPGLTQSSHMVNWTDDAERILSEDLHSRLDMCPRRNHSRLEGDYNKLSLMTKTKQVCAYPKLLNKYLAAEHHIEATSKLDTVVSRILENGDNGNGKLIFCNYKDEIDEIKTRLVNGGMQQVVVLDGRTTKKQRVQLLTFKNNVIILQIQTGCEGLNLQEFYSEVYFVSPHWNPAVEDQAVARCHRIGQTKPVFVHRFQMNKFVEEDSSSMDRYIMGVQESKRELMNGV